jgi:uncharacterized phiE125 gp8 family phage protein
MYQSTVITTPPDGLPLSLSIATQQLRKDLGDCDEELVVLTMGAVVDYVQRQYGLLLLTQTAVEYYSAAPCDFGALRLHNRPISAVTKVEYKDPTTGAWTTWDESVTTPSPLPLQKSNISPALGGFTYLYPLINETWPEVAAEPGALRITCTAGYGDTGETVPATIRSAMLLMLADFYENRENPQQSMNMTAAANLLRSYRELL